MKPQNYYVGQDENRKLSPPFFMKRINSSILGVLLSLVIMMNSQAFSQEVSPENSETRRQSYRFNHDR